MFRPALVFIWAVGFSMPAVAQDKDLTLPKNTIDCRQFKKTGPKEWMEVGTAVFDLGEINDINLTDQPVTPGYFKFGGIDLYPVLEGKCGAAAYVDKGKKDQAKGDYESALANFNKAILLDPKSAEAYSNRGSVYDSKGDYARAIADYDEALKLDPKLENAANQRTAAQEKLAKGSPANAPAEPQITSKEAGAVLREGLDPSQNAPEAAAQIPEQTSQDQAGPTSETKDASLQNQTESGSCRAKKLVYAANGIGNAEGGTPVIEIIFEGKRGEELRDAVNSEFVIREYRNNEIQWAYKGAYIQKNNSGSFEFVSIKPKKKKALALTPNYIKPNRDGTGESILYLGGLNALFTSEDNVHAFKIEGKRPTGPLPEVFYFDRCE